MKTQIVRNQINRAISKDKKDAQFLTYIMEVARNNGKNPSKKEMQQAVDFMYDYLMHVPALIDETMKEARKLNIQHVVAPVLEYVENYFLDPNDLIPDHMGILGLTDDAYLALRMVQSISEEYKRMAGVPMISIDLSSANQSVGQFLGPQVTQQLENLIAQAIVSQQLQNPLMQLANLYSSTFYVNDPIWGNASIDDVVNTRLGAMGVV